MKSPAGSELLARCKIVGTPAAGIPRKTVSMKPGLAGVPNLALKIWMQAWPHCGVAALAGSVPAVLRPPAMVSAAAAASPLVLMDMTVPFVNDGRALRTALLCWSVDERGPGQDRNGRSRDPLCAGVGLREVSASG